MKYQFELENFIATAYHLGNFQYAMKWVDALLRLGMISHAQTESLKFNLIHKITQNTKLIKSIPDPKRKI